MADDKGAEMGQHRLNKSQLENLIDPRYAATAWSQYHTFSKKSKFTEGKAKLDFAEARDDPAHAGTNSGIYEISTTKMKSQSYRLKDSHIINIGETGNDILTRIRGKFTGNKRSDWNKMARSYDLQVKFRSNQKKVKGASPHPHILECVELADFKLHHGQLPLLNAIKGKKIKHRDGDPAPRDRASVIIRKWAADNK